MKNRVTVLTYHQCTERPDPMKVGSLGRAQFRAQLSILKRFYNVLAIGEAMERLEKGTLPSRAVVITFDDGYRDNYTVALEELQRADLHATFFIATDFLDGGRMWNDTIIECLRVVTTKSIDLSWLGLDASVPVTSIEEKRAASSALIEAIKYLDHDDRVAAGERLAQQVGQPLPNDLMMTSDQVRKLRDAGMTIGGHTVSHPILTSISDEAALDEMRSGRQVLQQLLDEPIDYFAYPNGKPTRDYSAKHASLVEQAGFARGFSTEWGYIDRDSDHFQMPRVGFSDFVGWGFGLRLLRSYFEAAETIAQ